MRQFTLSSRRIFQSSLAARFRLAALGVLVLSLSACGAPSESDHDEVVVGLLLPFTGPGSATAANFERAALLATDRVNAAGGVQGHRLRILSKDTHSNMARSRRSARELIDAGASVVLGPESADFSLELLQLFTDHDVVFVSPLVADAGYKEQDCTPAWFRLSPSAKALGEALAKQLYAEGVESVAVLSSAAAYDAALSRSAADRFTSLGGSVTFEDEVDDTGQSYAKPLSRALTTDPDALLLAAPPRTGALMVNEAQVLTKHLPRWSLSPLLKTELFTLNVDPKAVEDALGVAPKIFDQSSDFPEAFARRWQDDVPLEGAYFYYDAVSLVALALQAATLTVQGRADASSLREAIEQVAAPPGEAARWDELEEGLQRLDAGQATYYSGLTGPMLLDRCGARRLGVTSSWTVHSGRIVTEP